MRQLELGAGRSKDVFLLLLSVVARSEEGLERVYEDVLENESSVSVSCSLEVGCGGEW